MQTAKAGCSLNSRTDSDRCLSVSLQTSHKEDCWYITHALGNKKNAPPLAWYERPWIPTKLQWQWVEHHHASRTRLHLQPIAAPLQIVHIDFCHSTAHDPLTQPFACFLPLLDLVASGFRTVEKIASFREDFNATGGCRRQHRSINFSSNVQPSWKGMGADLMIKPRRFEQKQSAPLCTFRVQLLVWQAASFDSCVIDIIFWWYLMLLFNKAYQHRNAWFPVYICILYSDTKQNWLSGNMNLDIRAKHQLPRDEDYAKKHKCKVSKYNKFQTPSKIPSLCGICEWARVQVQSQQTSSNTGVATIFRRLEWPWYCQISTSGCLSSIAKKAGGNTLRQSEKVAWALLFLAMQCHHIVSSFHHVHFLRFIWAEHGWHFDEKFMDILAQLYCLVVGTQSNLNMNMIPPWLLPELWQSQSLFPGMKLWESVRPDRQQGVMCSWPLAYPGYAESKWHHGWPTSDEALAHWQWWPSAKAKQNLPSWLRTHWDLWDEMCLCRASKTGHGGRYLAIIRAVCPVSVKAMISLPRAVDGWCYMLDEHTLTAIPNCVVAYHCSILELWYCTRTYIRYYTFLIFSILELFILNAFQRNAARQE